MTAMLKTPRRSFLRTGFAGMLSSLGGIQFLSAKEGGKKPGSSGGDDYKALVCVYLNGGNDSNNLLIPTATGQTARKLYDAARGELRIEGDIVELESGLRAPVGNSDEAVELGLHPACGELAPLYESGKLAFVCNVGPLLQPLANLKEYKSLPKPDYLFSHSDQKRDWHTALASNAYGASGWGGRLAEATAACRAYSLNQGSPYLRGRDGSALPYTVLAPGETVGLDKNPFFGGTKLHAPLEKMMELAGGGKRLRKSRPLEADYAAAFGVAKERALIVQGAFEGYEAVKGVHPESGEDFQWDDDVHRAFQNVYGYSAKGAREIGGLGQQFMAVARLIGRQKDLGESRHIFAVGAGGYDTHNSQAEIHGELLGELAKALRGFHDALVALDKIDSVVAFTASDFGRSLLPNAGGGSDHAWGGHSMLLGGPVRGGRAFGSVANYDLSLPDDLSMTTDARGRFIPGISVSEYCAVLANWFGAKPGEVLNDLFPELTRFPDPLKNPKLQLFG